MRHYNVILLATAAFFIFSPASADTVTTKTVVSQKNLAELQSTDFVSFDLNHDNILSMTEVGEKLFYIFDTDGNEVIDNIEFKNKKVVTIIPMEKQTFTFVDHDNDGIADKSSYTYETFIQQSHLMRFDDNADGLSPADFLERSFLEVDRDNSKAIELDEWKKIYIASVSPETSDPDHYNQQ